MPCVSTLTTLFFNVNRSGRINAVKPTSSWRSNIPPANTHTSDLDITETEHGEIELTSIPSDLACQSL